MQDKGNRNQVYHQYFPSDYYGAPAPAPHLSHYLLPFWRRKWLIVNVGLIAAFVAALVVQSITPRYTAYASVVLRESIHDLVEIEAFTKALRGDIASIESQIEIIRAQDTIETVANTLALHQIPEFNHYLLPDPQQIPTPAVPISLPHEPSLDAIVAGYWRFQEWAKVWIDYTAVQARLLVKIISRPLISPDASQNHQRESVLLALKDGLKVRQKGRSRAIEISFSSQNPVLAAQIANAFASVYIEAQIAQKFDRLQKGNQWLNKRIVSLQSNLDQAERSVEIFRSENGLVEGRGGNLVEQQITQVNAQLIDIRAEKAAAEAKLFTANQLLQMPGVIGVESASEVLSSMLIAELREQETLLLRQRADLSARYGEKHPTMAGIAAELENLSVKLKEEMTKLIHRLRNDVAVVRARERSLIVSLRALKDQVIALNTAEVELRARERNATAQRQILETFLQKYTHTSSHVDPEMLQADANIITHAHPPTSADYPKRKLIIATAGLAGLFIGCFLTLLSTQLERCFRSGRQIEAATGLRYLGFIPHVGAGNLTGIRLLSYLMRNPTSALAESLRNLSISISPSVLSNEKMKILSVTSAAPNEGKSTLAAALAYTLAQAGDRVLLIDGDVRVSSIASFFGLQKKIGLTDILRGHASFEDVVAKDAKSGLHVLNAGRQPSSEPSPITKGTLTGLWSGLHGLYDTVVIDCPPIMAVADARILSAQADGTIFAVRWGHTPQDVVQQALRFLRDVDADLVGITMTLVDAKQYALYGSGDSGAYVGAYNRYYGHGAK